MTDLERAQQFLELYWYLFDCDHEDVAHLLVEFAAAARREGIEATITILRQRVEAHRRVHDYTAADLLETNADAIRDLLLLDPEESI